MCIIELNSDFTQSISFLSNVQVYSFQVNYLRVGNMTIVL